MKFKLEIDCDNAAFDDLSAELATIISGLYRRLNHGSPVGGNTMEYLKDSNGNHVGSWKLETDASTKTYTAAGYTGRKTNRPQFVKTGEFRSPQPLEWFLSGALPEAYQMPPNNSNLPEPYKGTEYWILRAL